jgi:glycerate 2-kinase
MHRSRPPPTCSVKAGIAPVMLGDTVTGEAREVAKVYAALVRQIRARGEPFAPPVALISGGECTVTLPPGMQRTRRSLQRVPAVARSGTARP